MLPSGVSNSKISFGRPRIISNCKQGGTVELFTWTSLNKCCVCYPIRLGWVCKSRILILCLIIADYLFVWAVGVTILIWNNLVQCTIWYTAFSAVKLKCWKFDRRVMRQRLYSHKDDIYTLWSRRFLWCVAKTNIPSSIALKVRIKYAANSWTDSHD